LTLLLVRHGETAFNASGRIQGHIDIPLSAEGRTQARLLARRLRAEWSVTGNPANKAHSLPGPPAFWFTSDLVRASETATLLRDALIIKESEKTVPLPPLVRSALLRERFFGARQGLTAEEAHTRFGSDTPFDGESVDDVWRRMTEALAFIWETCFAAPVASGADPKRPIALVTGHGGTLRAFLCFALGAGSEAMGAFSLANTGVSVIEIKSATTGTAKGRVVLANDTAHLSHAFRQSVRE